MTEETTTCEVCGELSFRCACPCEICEEHLDYCNCLRCMNCGTLFSWDDAEEELVYDEENNYEGTCKKCVADPSRQMA